MAPIQDYTNEVVRAGAHAGLSILELMSKELLSAAGRNAPLEYLQGLATGIVIVRSPYSWMDGDPRIKDAVAGEIREARARAALL